MLGLEIPMLVNHTSLEWSWKFPWLVEKAVLIFASSAFMSCIYSDNCSLCWVMGHSYFVNYEKLKRPSIGKLMASMQLSVYQKLWLIQFVAKTCCVSWFTIIFQAAELKKMASGYINHTILAHVAEHYWLHTNVMQCTLVDAFNGAFLGQMIQCIVIFCLWFKKVSSSKKCCGHTDIYVQIIIDSAINPFLGQFEEFVTSIVWSLD